MSVGIAKAVIRLHGLRYYFSGGIICNVSHLQCYSSAVLVICNVGYLQC